MSTTYLPDGLPAPNTGDALTAPYWDAARAGKLRIQKCRGCGACLLTCPEHAIRPGGVRPLVVLADLCTECGECIEVCPADAIEMTI